MAEVGILSEDARVELIEGEIIDMASAGTEHCGLISQLTRFLVNAVAEQAHVRVQLPVRLSDITEPVPDLALVAPRPDFYKRRHPGPNDTFLLIEVSQSSLRYDLQIKAPLYARHGIPEYWVINLAERQIRFFRSPNSGQYTEVATSDTPGVVTPVALPTARIDLTGVLDE